jgi:hypothetical protein
MTFFAIKKESYKVTCASAALNDSFITMETSGEYLIREANILPEEIDKVFYELEDDIVVYKNELQLQVENNQKIEALKEAIRRKINSQRIIAEKFGFEAFGKIFDSDPASLARINVAVSMARTESENFSVEWTCKDNSTIVLTREMILQLPTYIFQAGLSIHLKAQNLKNMIEIAASEDELLEIDWDT